MFHGGPFCFCHFSRGGNSRGAARKPSRLAKRSEVHPPLVRRRLDPAESQGLEMERWGCVYGEGRMGGRSWVGCALDRTRSVATMTRPDAPDRLTYLPLHQAPMLSVQPAVAPLVVADLVDGALLVGRAAVGDIASV